MKRVIDTAHASGAVEAPQGPCGGCAAANADHDENPAKLIVTSEAFLRTNDLRKKEKRFSAPRRLLRNELAPMFFDCLATQKQPTPSQTTQEPELANALVTDASRERASDIHLEPQSMGTQIRFRIDGAIYDVATVSSVQGRLLSNQFKATANLDPIVRFTPKDAHATFHSNGASLDLRLAIAPAAFGEAISIRLLDSKRLERSMRELGLTAGNLELLEDWVENSNGLFLAAGPTGCGKTTTLYALLHELKFADRVILSVEDPVEYRIDGITQIEIDQLHHLDFAAAVRSMLRLDPDYLMVGEIRDQPSAQSAVNAAINGRILLSTIHSRDAIGAITALRNWKLADHEIAESLSVVVAQRLVRKLCPHCREISTPSANDASWLKSTGLPVPERIWDAKGCKECRQLGHLGREGIFELWRLDESDYDLILKHADEHALRRQLRNKGHATLVTNGLAKVTTGTTTLSELRHATAGWYGPQMSSSPDVLNKS